jgi:hypothetical protein
MADVRDTKKSTTSESAYSGDRNLMTLIDMRLPHKNPVRFIKEVQIDGENHAVSLVEFKEKPTLAAAVEAAAQNVVFIRSLYEDFDGGVLTGMKNIEFLEKMDSGIYQAESIIMTRLDNFCMIRFTLSMADNIYAKGEMNIVMQERV